MLDEKEQHPRVGDFGILQRDVERHAMPPHSLPQVDEGRLLSFKFRLGEEVENARKREHIERTHW